MKTNIAILSVNNNFAKKLAESMSNKLDMFFADFSDLVKYYFVTEEAMELASFEYLEKKEKGVLKEICNYSNAILTIPINKLNSLNGWEKIKETALTVFLKLSDSVLIKTMKDQKDIEALIKIETSVLKDRNLIYAKNCDITLDIENSDVNTICSLLEAKIKKFYNVGE